MDTIKVIVKVILMKVACTILLLIDQLIKVNRLMVNHFSFSNLKLYIISNSY